MPWCDTCDQYLAPPAVTPDGRCPTCGKPVEQGQLRAERAEARRARKDEQKRARRRGHRSAGEPTDDRESTEDGDDGNEEELPPVPWHFKLLVAAVVVYLGYRFFQLLEWFWT